MVIYLITTTIMTQYIIKAPNLHNTTIDLPASKSISNRALIIHALSGGKGILKNLSDCDDTKVMVAALEHNPETIDIMAAGTAMRFMTAYLSATPGSHVITGTERMLHRPIEPLVNALRRLGADISYEGEEGFPPLRINGSKLDGGDIEIPGNISSQYISALLLIAPILENGLRLHLTGEIVSRPYIDLTLHVMHGFGCQAEWTDVSTIEVKPQEYQPNDYHIENDWSAASYWYEIVALSRANNLSMTLSGLADSSRQGDSVVKYLFNFLGVKTQFEKTDAPLSDVTLATKPYMPTRFDYDFIKQPDLAQTLVVTCCAMGIPFRFTGLASLKIKETDRIEALKTELRKVGYVISDKNGSELVWDGERCEPQSNPAIDTYQDHRMAMAFAPLAITMGEIRINDPEVVSKSYPKYWEDLKKAGFTITESLIPTT
jgi:3-phosphoshikimate 1-carboxyvinyltransferase